jgi:glycosyltransferase involved in cell wall biosynthesis
MAFVTIRSPVRPGTKQPMSAIGPTPMSSSRPHVLILGTRGIPAAHGGFETFAERLSLFLVARGWRVTVYCQNDVPVVRQRFAIDEWRGIERVTVAVARSGAHGTIEFDWHATRHAAAQDGVCLVLGYNTAMFLVLLRLAGRKILTNMDGIEWRRPKWSRPVRAWFYVNEWLAAWLSHRLVADHPAIADHLASRRNRRAIAMIPYGGDRVTSAPAAPVEALGLVPDRYLVSIARIEPDNNILPMVRAFSREPRGARLVVLGSLDDAQPYHRAVRAAASPEVLFPGAIYDRPNVAALRFHARAYCHGHTVGGTNPSLVESLACGNAVLAHRNRFNLWTAGPGQFFFSDEEECGRLIGQILADDAAVARARSAARARAGEFDWTDVLGRYETELATLGVAEIRPPEHAAEPASGSARR